jgi:tetratricopeptide (TPR) repeat protein
VAVDWASAAAWHKRDFAFGDLRKFDDARPIIAMQFFPGSPVDQILRNAWLSLEQSCAILDAVGHEGDELLLRYAALNWKLPRLFIDDAERVRMACSWLIDIADAYRIIAGEQPQSMPWFLNPIVRIDLNVRPRIAFLSTPPDRHELPPEAIGKHVTWDERSLVFHIGTMMKRLVAFHPGSDSPFQYLLQACCHERPWKRWKTIDALEEAIGHLDVDVSELRSERRSEGWNHVEEGFGWLELGENELALTSFRAATAFREYSAMAQAGEICARDRIQWAARSPIVSMSGIVSGGFTARKVGVARPLSIWKPRTEIQHKAVESPSETLDRALQAFHLGDLGHAEALAHQVRAFEGLARPATLLIAEIHLRRRQFDDALGWLEPLLAAGDDARAEYVRAKAMFAAGRLLDAHDGFLRTLALEPTMIEAMLLRREVDRALSRVRAKVGDGEALAINLPAGLENLRHILLSGDTRRAIDALDDARLHSDSEAQLVLARYLAMDGQLDRALVVYDRIGDEHRFTAHLGKASTLLELDRDESALALYDALVAEKPSDAEASEGRARALEKLGRIGEAAAEYRRFISLATAGSDLRVRAAQEWLDAHPL